MAVCDATVAEQRRGVVSVLVNLSFKIVACSAAPLWVPPRWTCKSCLGNAYNFRRCRSPACSIYLKAFTVMQMYGWRPLVEAAPATCVINYAHYRRSSAEVGSGRQNGYSLVLFFFSVISRLVFHWWHLHFVLFWGFAPCFLFNLLTGKGKRCQEFKRSIRFFFAEVRFEERTCPRRPSYLPEIQCEKEEFQEEQMLAGMVTDRLLQGGGERAVK